MKFLLFLLLGFWFIGCSNHAENGSTIHNESNINPSVGNNTLKLDTGFVSSRNSTDDRLIYQEYFASKE